MAFLFSHNEEPLNRTDLILQKDSEDHIETTKNDSVTFKGYFGESDDELNKRFDEKILRSYYYFTGAICLCMDSKATSFNWQRNYTIKGQIHFKI